MDYAQERVTTLHDLGDADPAAPVGRATVLVPMTEREYGSLAAERLLRELERVDPERVLVPLRAPADRVGAFADWLASFDLPLSALWCNGSRVDALFADGGLDGPTGKGRDVWLGLGVAARGSEFVVLHDADARTADAADVRRLVYPLGEGFAFAKGYYARVEQRRLYGRLCRLLYEPLVAALTDAHDAGVLDYLGAFRYALAGECAMTADFARSVRVRRRWGLEVGTLAEAFAFAGFEGSAQVDLGRYEHDHRAVSGPTGLSEMSEGVAAAVLHAVEADGADVEYETLPDRYRATAERFVRSYAVESAFNGLEYDREAELSQVETYAGTLAPPGADRRLPAWTDAPFSPEDVAAAAAADLTAAGADATTVPESGSGER